MTDKQALVLRSELVPADGPAIDALVRACAVFRGHEIDISNELVQDRLEKGAKSDYHFVIAERDGKVVGFCNFGHIACTTHSYDLYWIATDPSAQRGGVARKLLAEAERRIHALGGRRVYIETSSLPLYEPARKFYLACGYKTDCIQEDFYAPGDGKVTFVKAMKD